MSHDWRSPLLCCPKNCCCDVPYACACPCLYFGQIVETALEDQEDVEGMGDFVKGLSCIGCLMYGIFTCGCSCCIGNMFTRLLVRQHTHVHGDACSDCCVGCFCYGCAYAQEQYELEHYHKDKKNNPKNSAGSASAEEEVAKSKEASSLGSGSGPGSGSGSG